MHANARQEITEVRAGDIAAANLSREAMIAGDITKNLGNAFKELYKIKSIP